MSGILVYSLLTAVIVFLVVRFCQKTDKNSLQQSGRLTTKAAGLWLGAFVAAWVWHMDVVGLILSNRHGDSFHTLNLIRQAGLTVWAAILIIALLWLSDAKSHGIASIILNIDRAPRFHFGIALIGDFALTSLLFLIWYSLAPQLFYLYYLIVIPGLPVQWVANSFKTQALYGLIKGAAPTSYAELSALLTLSTMLFLALFRQWITLATRQPPIVLAAATFVGGILWHARKVI